ncbi:DUF1223 domain-containing protein [Thalassotalea euphylliae]|uniref:DUF1223 domain-containing protein n=1 Tax=Thalassotalea euphylliae TaxID=1655234 RepID=UPI0015F2612E|nr:DUF1223 domain-containing protein [Thalassotalea euphylliae]
MNSANAQTFVSPKQQVNLVEVYSSQGCSSCPPAEKWLSQFKEDQRLFSQFIPINLHVDYWDYIGWKDPYALSAFTKRQQNYQRFGHTKNIATPGFVVNGKGWNGWFYRQRLPIDNQLAVGELSAQIKAQEVLVSFDGVKPLPPFAQAHIAILGFDQITRVTRGENRGRALPHDFVVIDYQQASIKTDGSKLTATLPLPHSGKFVSNKKAIVVWLSERFDPKPIQAVGGWLE